MKLPLRRRREVSRGQALVEFAIILPVLALLLLLAVDFGRVFFGWVALNNATRIAANEAALDPTAWVSPVDAVEQAKYRQQVLNDLQAINCAPIGGGAWDSSDISDPVFVDHAGTGDPHELGDHVTVTLHCGFTFLTPLVGNIMGNPMTISARSDFAIRGGIINGVPVQTALPVTASPSPTPTLQPTAAPTAVPCTAPQMVGLTVSAAKSAWGISGAGFTGGFTAVKNTNGTNAPNNWIVISQGSHVGGQSYPCTDAASVVARTP
jgi:rhodanese-related sulfurtransferase